MRVTLGASIDSGNAAGIGGAGGGGAAAPATPVLTAPATGLTFLTGESVTVSATSSDGDLDRVDFVLDPGGSEVIIATDAAAAYSQSWTVAQALGAHTLVARAVRGGQSTDSASISLSIANPTRVVEVFIANGTWTPPANFVSPLGVRNKARGSCWAEGAGGTTAVGAGGGGEFREDEFTATPAVGVAIVVGAGAAANTDAIDTSIGTTLVVAKGGKSGTNGGAGGTGGTGATHFDGGAGVAGAGNTTGGGGAGSTAAGVTTTPGAPDGGFSVVAAAGRFMGGGGGSAAAAQTGGGRGEARIAYDAPATAGFPRVRARTASRDATNGTSRAVTMPTGIVAGELLLLIVVSDGASISITETVGGWTALTALTDASQVSMQVFWKIAAGSDTATVATSASESVVMCVYRISGATSVEQNGASANTTNPNPPSLTASGGSAKILWITAAGWDNSAIITIGGVPTNYTRAMTIPAVSNGGVALCTAERFNETATEDPGTYTCETEQHCVATLAIIP